MIEKRRGNEEETKTARDARRNREKRREKEERKPEDIQTKK